MSELVIAASIIVWLFLGGWAFYRLSDDLDRRELGALFLLCILLAPFMAGLAKARQIAEEQP